MNEARYDFDRITIHRQTFQRISFMKYRRVHPRNVEALVLPRKGMETYA